ncbi:MAG: hypothetical protein AB3N20_21475 [Rhizobiaceae bacterium]
MKLLFALFVILGLGLVASHAAAPTDLRGSSEALLVSSVENIAPTAGIGRCCSKMPEVFSDLGFPCHSEVQPFLELHSVQLPDIRPVRVDDAMMTETDTPLRTVFRPPIA